MLAIIAMLLSSGCGIAIQTGMGWTSVESRQRTESRTVTVNSVPPAVVVCRDEGETCRELGDTPIEDEVAVQVQAEVETTSTVGLWMGMGLEIVTAIVAIAASPARCRDESGNCPAGIFLTAAAGIVFGVVDMMTAVIYPAFTGEQTIATEILDAPPVFYRGEKNGYQAKTASVAVGQENALVLRLDPHLDDIETALVDAAKKTMIVAVMPVSEGGASLPWIDELGRRLRVDLTAAGIQTVEQATQKRALAAAVCEGDDCYAEVGRALAASHVLRSRVTQLGARCVLAAELVDLAREVTVSAVGARADCEDDEVVGKLAADLARDLLSGFRTGSPSN